MFYFSDITEQCQVGINIFLPLYNLISQTGFSLKNGRFQHHQRFTGQQLQFQQQCLWLWFHSHVCGDIFKHFHQPSSDPPSHLWCLFSGTYVLTEICLLTVCLVWLLCCLSVKDLGLILLMYMTNVLSLKCAWVKHMKISVCDSIPAFC